MDKSCIVYFYCGNIPVWELPPDKVQCQHWWPPESDSPCQPWCWTRSRKPPFEHCSCGGATEQGTWKEHQSWSLLGSVHRCQWRCYRWNAVKGSVQKKLIIYTYTLLELPCTLLSTYLPRWKVLLIPVAARVEGPRQSAPPPQSFHWAHQSGMRWPSRCLPEPLYHHDAEGG